MTKEDVLDNIEMPDPEKPEEIIDEITEALDDIHEELVDKAMKVGEQKDRYSAMREFWVTLGDQEVTDPELTGIYASGLRVLSTTRDEILNFRMGATSHYDWIDEITPSSDVIAMTTGSTASMMIPGFKMPESPPFAVTDRHASTRGKLNRLDRALVKTYDEIREVLYGTRADPERGALFLLRQSYDHFFGILAPDDEVRKSIYWMEKQGERPELVTREERIEYAANTHLPNPVIRKKLLESARHMVKVYRSLNRAHERGELDPSKAKTALNEMQVVIESWSEALII